MTRKTKPVHYCRNHPSKRSSAHCSICNTPLCSSCLLFYKGKHYCATTCLPDELKPAPQKKQSNGKVLKPVTIVIWSACTLALCSIVFAAKILQEFERIKLENEALQNSRTVLLSRLQIQSSDTINGEYMFDSLLQEQPHTSIINAVKSIVHRNTLPKKPPETLAPFVNPPYSFDNGSIDKKTIALTFDGASLANAAPEILDTLQSRDVRASMFITGQFVKKFPDIVNRLFAEHHDVCNHTATHPHLTSFAQNHSHITLPGIDPEFVKSELMKNDAALFAKTGYHFSPLWRAPYGEYNAEICRWGRDAGFTHIGWRQGKNWSENLDSHDWIPDSETPGFKSPDEVLSKIIALAETKPYGINGGIILMHLGTDRKNREDQVHLKLGLLIDTLRSMGYIFVPVSEMIQQTHIVSADSSVTDSNRVQALNN